MSGTINTDVINRARIRLRNTVLLGVCLLLGACTSNPLALKLLYGQLDNFMARELLNYADFSADQEAMIRAEVDRTVAWHRSEELPRYAELMSTFEQRMVTQRATRDDVEWVFDQVLELGYRFDQRSPMLAMTPALQSLNDQQIEEIAERYVEEFAEERTELEKLATKDAAEEAVKNLAKATRRIGLKMTNQQREHARKQFAQRRLSRLRRHAIWEQWGDERITLLRNRDADDFISRFRAHHAARLKLIETRLPQDWAHDHEIYTQLILDLFQSLNQQQRDSISKRISSLIEVAEDLAADSQIATVSEATAG